MVLPRPIDGARKLLLRVDVLFRPCILRRLVCVVLTYTGRVRLPLLPPITSASCRLARFVFVASRYPDPGAAGRANIFDFSDPESRSGTKASLWWPEAPSAVTTQTHQTTRVVRHQWHTSSMGGAVESADPLTCPGPIQPRVMRQVDDAHAAAPELGDDRIRAEGRARGEGH